MRKCIVFIEQWFQSDRYYYVFYPKKSAINSNETLSDLGKCFLGCKSVTTHQLVWKDHLLHALYINILSLCVPPHRSLLKEDQWLFWKSVFFDLILHEKKTRRAHPSASWRGKIKMINMQHLAWAVLQSFHLMFPPVLPRQHLLLLSSHPAKE